MPTIQIKDIGKGGIIPDQPAHTLPMNVADEGLNVRFTPEGILAGCPTIPTKYTDASGDFNNRNPYYVDAWIPAGSNQLFLAVLSKIPGGDDSIIILRTDTLAYDDITNASLLTTFAFEDKATLTVFNEVLVVNTGASAPQFIRADAPTGTNLQEIPNWFTSGDGGNANSVRAGRIVPWGDRLVAMDLYNTQGTGQETDDTIEPITLAISSTAASYGSLESIEWLIASTNDADDNILAQTPGRIIDAIPLREALVVYKEDSIFRIAPTGSVVQPFRYDVLNVEDGLLTSECAANFDNSFQFFVGSHGIYVHDGASQFQNISKGVVENEFFDSITPATKDRTFVFKFAKEKEIWVCYSSPTNTGSGCDSAWVWSYQTKVWYKRTIPNVTSLLEVDFGGVNRVFGVSPDDDGSIREMDMSSFESGGYLEYNDRAFDQVDNFKRVSKILVEATTDFSVDIQGAANIGESKFFDLQPFVAGSTYKVDLRRAGRYMSLRMQMDGTTPLGVTNLGIEVIGAGRR